MSKTALLLEAASAQHLAAHFPYNPWCSICWLAYLKQQRYARRGERQDDELDKITMPLQELSCDSIIVSKSKDDTTRLSASGCLSSQVIRDTYSGASFSFPERHRTIENMIKNFKFFVGPRYSNPHIMVKSDAAREIISAVEHLGWHSIPSLENTWPHNTVHERHQGKLKSVRRASMLQSGIPQDGWDVAATYSYSFDRCRACPHSPL